MTSGTVDAGERASRLVFLGAENSFLGLESRADQPWMELSKIALLE